MQPLSLSTLLALSLLVGALALPQSKTGKSQFMEDFSEADGSLDTSPDFTKVHTEELSPDFTIFANDESSPPVNMVDPADSTADNITIRTTTLEKRSVGAPHHHFRFIERSRAPHRDPPPRRVAQVGISLLPGEDPDRLKMSTAATHPTDNPTESTPSPHVLPPAPPSGTEIVGLGAKLSLDARKVVCYRSTPISPLISILIELSLGGT